MTLSLVDQSKLEKDPRKLAFLYPRMPASRYKEKTEEYYRQLCLQRIEAVARMHDSLLVPAPCIHHKRRDPKRRLTVFGRTYYVIPEDELTRLEEAKYRAACQIESGEAAAEEEFRELITRCVN